MRVASKIGLTAIGLGLGWLAALVACGANDPKSANEAVCEGQDCAGAATAHTADEGSAQPVGACGDGECAKPESCASCSADCGVCSAAECSALEPSTSASDGWTNVQQSVAHQGVRVEFMARPSANELDALVALSDGTLADFSGAPIAVRFNADGQLDARDGGEYASESEQDYQSGKWYSFLIEADLEKRTYNVKAGECGSERTSLVNGAAFRSDSPARDTLNHLALWSSQAAPIDVSGVGWTSIGECEPTSCQALGYSCGTPSDGCGTALSCGSCADGEVCMAGQCGESKAAGLFVTRAALQRARNRASLGAQPFGAQANLLKGRADEAMGATLDAFHMDDVRKIKFGWCDEADYAVFDTLKDATTKFEKDGDRIRSLGLQYALSGEKKYADKAVELMLAYQADQTIVNLHDLSVNYENATLRGEPGNNDYCSEMPWNFALDAMWQTYGLINVSDAYLLLTRNGYELSANDDATLRAWILELVNAVNSSFHAWTKWADLHPTSSSFTYYRSDNHLFWSMAGLIAGAAALGDKALADYVLQGGSWTDSRSGAYANPSFAKAVINRSISDAGVIFEETVPRDPPIGYSFFHLWAMVLVAEVAEVHFDAPELWDYQSPNGGSLRKAFDRYADYILGTATSDHPQEPDFGSLYGWLFEPAVSHWNDPKHASVLEKITRNAWIVQSVGPAALLLGPEP